MIGRVRTRTGAELPVLGQGTWGMGESARRRNEEVDALKLGFDLGMTLVDTAEMYGNGGAEEIVGKAIRGRREEILVVSKVLPQNASRNGTVRAAERSLSRLGTDWIDLYLLHWPGSHPLEETLAGFLELQGKGKIRGYGLSNFDIEEIQTAERIAGGTGIAVDQVLYNLNRRGIERRLLPWCSEWGIAVMAYSPLEQMRLKTKEALRRVARRHEATPTRVALAWTIRHESVVAIPKTSHADHVRDNAAAADLCLTEEDLADLDRAYPPPSRDVPLEVL